MASKAMAGQRTYDQRCGRPRIPLASLQPHRRPREIPEAEGILFEASGRASAAPVLTARELAVIYQPRLLVVGPTAQLYDLNGCAVGRT